MTPMTGTLADIGERELIRAVAEVVGDVSRPAGDSMVLIGPGDDAALVRVGGGQVLVSTDVAVEGRHFRRDWASAADVGHRVAAANLADMAAMGGVARALVLALSAPPDLPVQWALELAEGFRDECALVGARLVGGDVAEADTVSAAVTVLGEAPGAVVRRDGARAGDVVAVVGRIGWAAAGLAVLSRGFRSPRVVVDAYRRPEPPYTAGPAAAAAGATAMIDVSDGLLADLDQIARASGVAVDVQASVFELAEPLRAVGAALGADPLGFVLGGGDDHPLAATFPADSPLPDGWTAVGSVAEGEGVTVDGEVYEGQAGHRHFSG